MLGNLIAQDPALDDFFHVLEYYWTELREEAGPQEVLMLEDGSVDDPYVGHHVVAADDSEGPDMNESLEALPSDEVAPMLELAPLTPETLVSEPGSCNPHKEPEPLPPPEAALSQCSSENPMMPEQAPPSTFENPGPIPEPLPLASQASPTAPSAEDPGKKAEVAAVTPTEAPCEPAPSTPKLQKLPRFEIPGPEHERTLLKAQMDQQIAALRPGWNDFRF